ncbi:MAG: hypothetical protein RL748_1157, partial [Pseudomonadota bacterium]
LPVSLALSLLPLSAQAEKTWHWQYASKDIKASGTLTTGDEPDANGYFLVTSIKGKRNGQKITGLVPKGESIPGNEPYTVDDLIRISKKGQLTGSGIGFTTADGVNANPFCKEPDQPASCLEFSSQKKDEALKTAEVAIEFSASTRSKHK